MTLTTTETLDLIHPLSPSHRKEIRFYLPPCLSVSDVASEIRKQTGIKDHAPFNLKWLDVEGDPQNTGVCTLYKLAWYGASVCPIVQRGMQTGMLVE